MAKTLHEVNVQTQPRKVMKSEQASHLHSDVRESFFKCLECSFDIEEPHLKHFDPPGNKSKVLLAEVKRYVGVMRRNYIEGKIGELDFVQPEIRDHFWPNTQSCMRYDKKCVMKCEKDFTLVVNNEKMEATVRGRTDHTIHYLKSGIASLILEDKAVCSVLTTKEVAQVVAQINFEVGAMEEHLNYAPQEYVGILQNGPDWIAVMRKIDKGRVCWTYVQAASAFTIDNASTKSGISEVNCKEIVRLIEHAYCVADNIMYELSTKCPMYPLYSIKEYQNEFDDEEDENDHDSSKRDSNDPAAPGKVNGTVIARPAEQSVRQSHQQSKNTASAGSKKSHSATHNSDYYIMPLTIANVNRHENVSKISVRVLSL